jgi:hypothetical protein
MRDSIDKRDGGLDRRSVLVLACGAMCSHALGCGGSCHGSQYDIHGNVVAPPATRPLPHLSVTADVQGNLTVHRDQTVDPSTRLST